MEAPFTSRPSGRFRYIHLEGTIVGPKHFHKRKPLLQENILLIKEHEIVGIEGNWVGFVNHNRPVKFLDIMKPGQTWVG